MPTVINGLNYPQSNSSFSHNYVIIMCVTDTAAGSGDKGGGGGSGGGGDTGGGGEYGGSTGGRNSATAKCTQSNIQYPC